MSPCGLSIASNEPSNSKTENYFLWIVLRETQLVLNVPLLFIRLSDVESIIEGERPFIEKFVFDPRLQPWLRSSKKMGLSLVCDSLQNPYSSPQHRPVVCFTSLCFPNCHSAWKEVDLCPSFSILSPNWKISVWPCLWANRTTNSPQRNCNLSVVWKIWKSSVVS